MDQSEKKWNIVIWIIQIILASIFILAGFMKATQPIDVLGKNMSWVYDFPAFIVRFVGIAELLGGIALILPALLRIQPWLTPMASLGLLLIMVFAAVYHLYKGEYSAILINLILAGMASLVAWGRFSKAAILPKNV